MNDEERELRALRCRSEMALQSIIERYTPYVSAVISNIIGGSMVGSDVEEAAADVFFVLWENASRSAAGFAAAFMRPGHAPESVKSLL